MKPSDQARQENEWVTSPEFMRGALLTLAVGSLLAMAVIRWLAPEQTLRALGPVGALLLSLVAWRVLVLKGVERAKQVLGVGGLVYVLLLGYAVAGVLTPAIIALPVLLTMIGWLFNPRAAIWATGLTIAALWGMVWGAQAGWVSTSMRTTPAMYATIQSLLLVLTAYMTVYVFNRYTDRVRQVTRTSEELCLRTQELEASKLRLQVVIEASGTVFWEYDVTTDTLTYDTKRLSVLGMDDSRPPGNVREWVARVHPDDRSSFVELFRGTVRDITPLLEHDYRVQGVSDEWVWIAVRGAVVRRQANGRPAVVGGAVVNIQARKVAEAALQASEQQARHLAACRA